MHEQFSTPLSAEDAFNYIVDFSHIDEWDHTILSAKKASAMDIDGPSLGLGTQFDLVFSTGGRKTPLHYEITEYEASNHAVLHGTSKSFTAIDTISIEENEMGCTVTWHAEINFSGLSALIMPLLSNKVKAMGNKTIQSLNKMLDSMAHTA